MIVSAPASAFGSSAAVFTSAVTNSILPRDSPSLPGSPFPIAGQARAAFSGSRVSNRTLSPGVARSRRTIARPMKPEPPAIAMVRSVSVI